MKLGEKIWSGHIRWDFISFGPERVREAVFDSDGGGRGTTEKIAWSRRVARNTLRGEHVFY